MIRKRLGTLAWAATTLLAAFVMFFPILWMALTSLKTENDAIAFPPKWFFTPTFDNWRIAVFGGPVLEFMGNTAWITVASTLLALALGFPAAYAMAYYRTKRTDGSMLWMMSTRMLPPAGVIVPLFVIFRDLSLLDTHLGLILLFAGMNLPLVVWMLTGFMEDVPFALIEAARLDGASLWQEFTRVLLPLLLPGLAATALLALIFTWNEFFWPLVVLTTPEDIKTLPIGLLTFRNVYAGAGDWGLILAGAVLSALPIIILFVVFQRYFLEGVSYGGSKE